MGYRLGIDLGGTNIAAGIVTDEGRIVGKASVPCRPRRPAKEVLESVAEASRLAAEDAGMELSGIERGGIGIPGVCDGEKGMALLAANLGWVNVDVAGELTSLLGFRPAVGNDADCAALGEYYAGFGSRFRRLVFITLGTGIGGGIVLDGKLAVGPGGGEIGHMVMDMGGDACPCGRRGCFERYASATALISQTKAAAESDKSSKIWEVCGGDLQNINGRTAFDAAELGDSAAAAVVDGYITYLAEGIANLVNILRPDAIVIGGGVSRQGDALMKPLDEKLRELVYASDTLGLPVVCAASLGNDAGIIGAAML